MTFPPDWFEMPEDQAIAFEDELRRECMRPRSEPRHPATLSLHRRPRWPRLRAPV